MICKPLKRLTISVDVEKEEHTLMGYLVVRDAKKPNTDSEDAWIRGADDRNCQTCEKIRPSAVFQDLSEPAHGKIVIYLFAEYIEQILEGVSLPFRIQISDR